MPVAVCSAVAATAAILAGKTSVSISTLCPSAAIPPHCISSKCSRCCHGRTALRERASIAGLWSGHLPSPRQVCLRFQTRYGRRRQIGSEVGLRARLVCGGACSESKQTVAVRRPCFYSQPQKTTPVPFYGAATPARPYLAGEEAPEAEKKPPLLHLSTSRPSSLYRSL